MRRPRFALIGCGKLGGACAAALRDTQDLELAGIVVRSGRTAIAGMPGGIPLVEHVSLLEDVRAALVCVPAAQVLDVARELLQQGVPVIECARLEARALQAHYTALAVAARHHRATAVLGAGWDPGVLTVIKRIFEVLIPHGRSDVESRPGMALHHTAAAAVPGVKTAVACERHAPDGRTQRYVYVEPEPDADAAAVEAAIASDPAYAGVETLVFMVPDVAALEPPASGTVLTRYGGALSGSRESLLLEARFDETRFAARVMVDAARALPWLKPGAHLYRPEGVVTEATFAHGAAP